MKLPLRVLSAFTLGTTISSLRAAPGDLDLTFGTNGVVSGTFTSIGLQSDGKIVAISGQSVRRFLPNGSPDASFGGGTGTATIPFAASDHERALSVQPDDRILVAGSQNEDFALMRLKADGTPDNPFGSAGVIIRNATSWTFHPTQPPFLPQTILSVDKGLGVVLLPDGAIVMVGMATVGPFGFPGTEMAACTFNASGQFVTSGAAPANFVSNFTALPGGQVFIAAGKVAGIYEPLAGSLAAFQSDPRHPGGAPLGIAARPDGVVLVTGNTWESGGFLVGLSPLNSWQFTSPQIFGHSFTGGISMFLQGDGHIILAGSELARYMPDGNLDPSFRTLQKESGAKTVTIQSDGKILTAGATMRRYEGTATSATIAVEHPVGTPVDIGNTFVDFGTINVGASATRTFTVRNTSALPLQLWKALPEGPSAPHLSTDKTFPLTVPAGGTTTFTLQWAPLIHGPLAATFHLINSDSAKRSVDILLKGYALTTSPEIEVQLDRTVSLTSGQPGIIRLSHFRPQAALTFTNAGAQPLTLNPVVTDGHASAFSLSAPLPATLAAGTSQTVSLLYAPGEHPASAVMHFGSNDSNENPFDIPVTGDPSTSSDVWRASWFSDAPAGAATGDTQDYDLDGIPNLLEYATFSSPIQSGPLAATLAKKGSVLELTLTRPLEATTELLYELEWTDALTTGPWKTLGTTSTVLSDDGIRQSVKFTVAAGSGSRFVRLKVTRVP